MFSSFSSFTSSIRELDVAGLAGGLVTQAQAGLKNAEGLVDHALGLPPANTDATTTTTTAAATPAAVKEADKPSTAPEAAPEAKSNATKLAADKPEAIAPSSESAPASSKADRDESPAVEAATSSPPSTTGEADIDAARIAEMLDEAVPSAGPDESAAAKAEVNEIAPSAVEPAESEVVAAAAAPVRKAIRTTKSSRVSIGSDSLSTDPAPTSEKKAKKPKKSLLAVAAIPSSPEAAPASAPEAPPAAGIEPADAVVEQEPKIAAEPEAPAPVVADVVAPIEETVAAGAAVEETPAAPVEPEPPAPEPAVEPVVAAAEPVAEVIVESTPPAVEITPAPLSIDPPVASPIAAEALTVAVASPAAPAPSPTAAPAASETPKLTTEPAPKASSARSRPPLTPAPVSGPSPSLASPSAAAGATPTIPSTPIPATPSAAATAADPAAAIQAALDRARHAEDVSSKLTRLLKIRELQLEKQSLESSRITDELRKAEERTLAQQGAAERDRERLEKKFNDLARQLAEEKTRSAALAAATTTHTQAARTKADNAEATQLALQAKDQQIAAVMAEGQELQRKQQKLETIIKKLREELAGKDDALRKLDADRDAGDKRVAELTTKWSDLKERYGRAKEDLQDANHRLAGLEAKLVDTESLLSASSSTVSDLRYSLQHAQDEKREKENALLKVQHELAQQHKTKASSSEELETLKAKDQEAQEREANLIRNVQETQELLGQERAERAAREETFQAELQAERAKSSEAAQRNEELLSAVPAATRPLLRQIESYASALQSSKEAWAGLEAQLNKRMHDLELQLVRATRDAKEHESGAREAALELADTQSRLKAVQEKLTALESTHRQLKAQFHALEEASRDAQGKQEDLLHQVLTLGATNDELKARVRTLAEGKESQEKKWEGLYQSERSRNEKLSQEVDQLRAAGSAGGQLVPTTVNTTTERDERTDEVSPRSSASAADPYWGSSSSGSGSASSTPLFGSDKLAVTSTVELLRSLLQQKEGEIKSLKEINRQVESGRSSLSDELVLLTSQLNGASMGLARLPQVESQLAAMTRRYDAACLIIGEKEETIDDLRQDVADMKAVFASQVDQLTNTIAELKKQQKA